MNTRFNPLHAHHADAISPAAAEPEPQQQPQPHQHSLALVINGEQNVVTLAAAAQDVASCSLQQVLEHSLGELPTHAIAVALNDRIIARSCWASTTVQPHDRIDCFQLVAGG